MQLRDYQRQAVDSIYAYFSCRTGNPLVVLPTGSGKSVVLGQFIREAMEYPNQHILLLSHVKEILEQNVGKIEAVWPGAPIGIFSAGLGRKELGYPITVASIQSVYDKAKLLGYQSLVLIDESHLVPKKGEGMYRQLLQALAAYNPKIKIVGFTATPYRLGSGTLTEGEGHIFTDICYEISISELVEQGFLCGLTSKAGRTQADLSHVKISQGEYVMRDAARAMEADNLTKRAIQEVLRLAPDRKAYLFFCVDVEHAQHVADELVAIGLKAECVTGKTALAERDAILRKFKEGKLDAVTNCNVLTTGFDHPGIDCLVLLRPTQSVGLYVQMVGRGCRVAPGKNNCLVLDFAGNIERHGPVDAVKIRGAASGNGKGASGAPVKLCPQCQSAVLLAVRICGDCGYAWPEKEAHEDHASEAPILASQVAPEIWEVDRIEYSRHQKEGKPDSFKVTYICGFYNRVSEWVCLEHQGFAHQKAVQWWLRRKPGSYPSTVHEGLVEAGTLLRPSKIQVRKVGKYPEVCGYAFDAAKEAQEKIPFTVDGIPEEWEKGLDAEGRIPF